MDNISINRVNSPRDASSSHGIGYFCQSSTPSIATRAKYTIAYISVRIPHPGLVPGLGLKAGFPGLKQ
jgi:hypothetical protein